MTPQLSRRLARALDVGEASPQERTLVVDAAQGARTFDDLPADVRALVVRLETPPAGLDTPTVDDPDALDEDSHALLAALNHLDAERGSAPAPEAEGQ